MRIIFLASFLIISMLPAYGLSDKKPFEIPRSTVHTIHSKILGRSYDLYVKLPFGYFKTKNTSRQYPTMYLNDGIYTFQVASGVTRLPDIGNIFNPTILVGISFSHGDKGMFSRVRDMTPLDDPSWANYETGGASDYLSFIETEVIPFIEKTYRSDASKRALSGQSLGASFGVYSLIKKPYLFKSYLLTSPSLWVSNRFMFKFEEEYSKKHSDLPVDLYFATGSYETPKHGLINDMVSLQSEFVSILRSRNYANLRIKSDIIEGSFHETTFPIGFTKGALWLYGTGK